MRRELGDDEPAVGDRSPHLVDGAVHNCDVRRWAVAAPYRLDWRALSMTIPSANLYRTTRPDLQEGCKRCPAPARRQAHAFAAQPARQLVLNGPRGWESRCLRSARPSTAISLRAGGSLTSNACLWCDGAHGRAKGFGGPTATGGATLEARRPGPSRVPGEHAGPRGGGSGVELLRSWGLL